MKLITKFVNITEITMSFRSINKSGMRCTVVLVWNYFPFPTKM